MINVILILIVLVNKTNFYDIFSSNIKPTIIAKLLYYRNRNKSSIDFTLKIVNQ